MESRIEFPRRLVDSWPLRLKICIPKRPSVVLRAFDEPLPLAVSRTGVSKCPSTLTGLETVARTGATSRGAGLGNISHPLELLGGQRIR